ncbi:hypothetical protein V5O48_000258 [Marasmius crinis-equi]|uniref:Uncharacterized protein n=1 Tax=Marasmius crinis-equi TaxID=585013 RepID=A0ABR3G1T2_9AGAR
METASSTTPATLAAWPGGIAIQVTILSFPPLLRSIHEPLQSIFNLFRSSFSAIRLYSTEEGQASSEPGVEHLEVLASVSNIQKWLDKCEEIQRSSGTLPTSQSIDEVFQQLLTLQERLRIIRTRAQPPSQYTVHTHSLKVERREGRRAGCGPRPDAQKLESKIIREVLESHWPQAEAAPPQDDLEIFVRYCKTVGIRFLEYHTHPGFRNNELLYFNPHLSQHEKKKYRGWNSSLSKWATQNLVIPRLNERLTSDGKPTLDSNDSDYQSKFDELRLRFHRHMVHVFREDAARRKSYAVRHSKLKQRLQTARHHQLKDNEEALNLLGADGMSSDEEDDDSSYPRSHSWRSESATELVVYLDDLKLHARRTAPGKQRGRKGKLSVRNGPDRQSTRTKVVSNLPENFYSAEKLAGLGLGHGSNQLLLMGAERQDLLAFEDTLGTALHVR